MELKTQTEISATQLENFPPKANPYNYDSSNMGQAVGKNLHMMFGNHSNAECRYLIFIESSTGKRFKIQPHDIFASMDNLGHEAKIDIEIKNSIQKKVQSTIDAAVATEIAKYMRATGVKYPEAKKHITALLEA